MSHRILIAVALSLLAAEWKPLKSADETTSQSKFEGTKAGGTKELSGIAFHWCPAATFTMGSPKTELGRNGKRYDNEDEVSVTLTKGFWLGETEVTQGQWLKVMKTAPWKMGIKEHIKEGANFPALVVSYGEAGQFCKKLTETERRSGQLPLGWKYSLPTEAQWEYGCRAGTTTKYSFGDDESKLVEYGWFGDNASKVKEEYAHQVGLKKPNAWGLKDMHGNVWEWCNDGYESKLAGGQDPQGSPTATEQVCRGGGWYDHALTCRSSHKAKFEPNFHNHFLGFRVAIVRE